MLAQIRSALLGTRKAMPARPAPVATYMRDSSSGLLSAWRPNAPRDGQDEVRSAWYWGAARAVDSLHNSGWLSGAVDQASADTIGTGLRLNSVPDADALGWSPKEAREWCRIVERRWRAWSTNPLECDARGKRTIGALTDAAIRYHFAFGEAVALLPRIQRPESRSAIKVLMVSPHRLVSETNELARMHQGVTIDGNGLPVSYRFRRRSAGIENVIDIKARSSDGRQQVVHAFDGAPDQVRGMTPLAPVLLRFRQYDQLSDATLTTTLIQTIIAATIKSEKLSDNVFEGLHTSTETGRESENDLPLPDEMQAYFEAKLGWWRNRSIDLGTHGRVAHMFPGEEFELHAPKTPNDTYLSYAKNLLREIARALGVTYEAMTGDYERATYSSVRMATSSVWGVTQRRRANMAVPFVQPIYAAWLGDEILAGRIPFKGGPAAFLAHRLEASYAEWTGPAKPTADDLKAAKAATERLTNATTSLTYECAEYGLDPESVMEQRAHDRELALSYGLPDPYAPKPGTPDTSGSGDDPAKED